MRPLKDAAFVSRLNYSEIGCVLPSIGRSCELVNFVLQAELMSHLEDTKSSYDKVM